MARGSDFAAPGKEQGVNARLVRKEHIVDAGEQDAAGRYDFYYAYHAYEVVVEDRRYDIRVYDDEPAVGYADVPPATPSAVTAHELRLVLEVLLSDGVNELHKLGASGAYEPAVRASP